MQLATMLNQLLVDAYLYLDLLRVSDDPINAGFEMTDTGETATMIISESISIQSGLIEPAFKLILTEDLLRQALNKEVDLFSLAGRAHINDKRPVDFEFIDRKRMKESMETLYRLATFFTIPGPVKWKKLSLDYAGTAHGARPIPLVYWKDLRTSWYHIPRGSVLNEAGEKDPWPQAFIL
ncbi:MAG: hypothetical protein JW779_12075, partial [Candidatus Thorarchaeota archaeon]|nr:hypothetical protein [Candidatus Thorarchaeota archaeon]